MISPAVQRWRERRDSYRPAGEPIDPHAYEVAVIPDDTTARKFVERHHYAGTYPAARFRHALYDRRGELVGVAVFSHPANNRTLTNAFPGSSTDAVELGRFVLLDSVPANGETWFLARCFHLLRQDVVGVVSFSDPVARTSLAGAVVFPGHVGTIYQAKSAVFLGRGARGTLRLLPDGRVLSNRSISKIRSRDRGWRYAAELLERAGAAPLAPNDNAAAWLAMWLPRLTRPLTHPGNLKYAFPLDRAARRALPPSLPYPKVRAPFQHRLFA
ncbi:MAG TPA: hypothetical protein VHO06_09520 [Polyangia bacterium]|nr:hypothetical protein [Polyangia bacterium]